MPTGNDSHSPRNRVKPRRFRIGERLEVRRKSANGGFNLTLTDEDKENVETFARIVDEATEILNTEIAAIDEGDFDVITERFERKNMVLKSIELQIPLVQPFLDTPYVQSQRLSQRLGALASAAKEGTELLERMAQAARTVATEIRRATERHSLKGLYGKSGRRVGESAEVRLTIDKRL